MALRNNHSVTIDPASPSWDYALGQFASITLDRDVTLPDLTNVLSPCSGILFVTQDATGGWTLTLPGQPTWNYELELDPNGVTILGFTYNDANGFIWMGERVQPDTSIPQLTAPVLSGSVVSDTALNQTWTDPNTSPGETNFELQRSPTGAGTWTTINSPAANATSYSDTGLTASTGYDYRIRAVGDGSTATTSNWSNTVTLTTNASGSFPSTNRVALYKNSNMVRSAGRVTTWTNADGDTAKDFTHITAGTDPIDATTDGMQFTGTENLAINATLVLTSAVTVYMLIKKTGTGGLFPSSNAGHTYGLWMDAASLLFRADGTGAQTGSVGIANMADFKVVAIVWTAGSAVKVYLDGTQVGAFSGSTSGTTWTMYGINGISGDQFPGYVKGLALFSGVAHTGTEVATNSPLFKTLAES